MKASILHYASVTWYFGGQGPWDPMWGTVGSGLTPGTCQDGQIPEISVLSGFRAGKWKMAHWCTFEFGTVLSKVMKSGSNANLAPFKQYTMAHV